MTTTTEALMALADAAINAESEATADAISGPTADAALSAEKAKAARAALASALAEVVKDAERWRDLVSLVEYGEFCVLGNDDIQFDTAYELECAVDDDEAQETARAWRHVQANPADARGAEQKGV